MFVLQNNAPASLSLSGTVAHPVRAGLDAAKFDLTLTISEQEDGLRAALQYRTDRFEATTIDRMLGHLGQLLSAIAAGPDQRVSEIDFLGPDERRELLVARNGAPLKVVPGATLPSLIAAQAERTPSAIAVVHGADRITYAELDARAAKLAARLRASGVRRGVLVGVCVERSVEMVVALLAVQKSGGAYVPLDPRYPAARLGFVVADAHLPVIVTQERVVAALPWLAEAAASGAVVLIRADLDTDPGPIAAPSDHGPRMEDLAYVIYTSGSTGQPKGVMIEHRNAVAFITWAQSVFTPGEFAGVLASTSISFDLSIFEIFATLASGGTVVVVHDVLELRDLATDVPITLVNTVPSAMAELVRSGVLPASVRTVNLAGEPLEQSLVESLYALPYIERVYDLYGPTETTTYSTFALREPGGRSSIGHPVANTKVLLCDRHGRLTATGAAGEIYIGGAGVARGYLNRPELTAQRFVPDPAGQSGSRMYRTGDRARWLADGTLEYLGRADQQIKLRGHRIELSEIEAVLTEHPGVTGAVVIMREDVPGHHRLVAYVVVAPGRKPSDSELRGRVRERLPAVMVPTTFVTLDGLPLTTSGKIDRRALPVPSIETRSATQVYVAPRTPLEREIARVWEGTLGVERVGLQDDFFELGGDSLLAMRMIVEVERVSGGRLSFRSFFEQPTIARAVTVLHPAAVDGKDRAVAVLQEGGPGTPLIFVHGDVLGQGWYCRRLAPLLGPAPLIVLPTLPPNNEDSPLTIEAMALAHLGALRTV
ncbi:MAG: non-ribosomal peptide synthetase, partial [Gemmatimonadales bacterium]